jgi:hypothetical protein
MRRSIAVLAGLLALLLSAPAQALDSDNVAQLGKLPDSAGAIGARFSPDGNTMYVTSATGLQIYDVSEAEAPRKLSQLALPHFENEDVDLGPGVIVITNDPSFSGIGAIYLIDVTDPSTPRIRSVLPTNVPIAGTDNTDNGHIANCINGCQYLYTTGTSEGLTVYDIRNLDAPRRVGTIPLPGNGFTHDVQVDDYGVAWVTGEDGTFGYTTADPLHPVLKYRSDPSIVNTGGGLPGDDGSGPLDFLHHNSMRVSKDLLAVTEEDYAKPTCEGQGSFQTWRITRERNADGTLKLALVDMWTTELNELAELEGRSPATVNCSAHWFDVDGGLVAQGWYDQGVRFLDISDPANITQVGYHVTQGTFWAAYFAPTDPARETVYALDTTSGIDVLHIDRPDGKMQPRRKAATEEELAARGAWGVPSARWGFAAPLPYVLS